MNPSRIFPGLKPPTEWCSNCKHLTPELGCAKFPQIGELEEPVDQWCSAWEPEEAMEESMEMEAAEEPDFLEESEELDNAQPIA